MRRAIFLNGFVFFLLSCANDGADSTNTTGGTDTVAAPNTTNYGGAGTGGVGAGFGAGGRVGTDTNLPSGTDTTNNATRQ